MAITVRVETPLQDDVRTLIGELNDYLLPTAPAQFHFMMSVEQMAADDTVVFIARDEGGQAVGCGALKTHDAGLGEIKRMFTRPTVRGQRVGSALLDAITDLATRQGMSRLVLETGIGPEFDAAWRLYERSGFTRCGVVLDYPDSEYSAFFEKWLALTPAE